MYFKYLLSIFVLLYAISDVKVSGQCDIPTSNMFFKKYIYELNYQLANKISYANGDKNFIVAPLSVWSFITQVTAGATNLKKELRESLRQHPHQCFNSIFIEIIRNITSENFLFNNQTVIMNQDSYSGDYFLDSPIPIFIELYQNVYYNERYQYGDLIGDMVSCPGVCAVLYDEFTIFSNRFSVEFEDNGRSTFYNGISNPSIPMMTSVAEFNFCKMDLVKAHIVELNFDNPNFAMLIFKPYDRVRVVDVINNLEKISVRSIYYMFETTGKRVLEFTMPEFFDSYESNNLEELLIDMGLNTVFKSETYIPLLSNKMASLRQYIQHTVIALRRASSVENAMIPQEIFRVDRPFLYMLVHKPTEVVLATGGYIEPQPDE